MKISKKRLRKIIKEEILKEAGSFTHDVYTDLTGGDYPKSKAPGGKGSQEHYQGFSSKEAKNVIDKELKMWAKDLRKVQYRVIKSWMSKAKAGVIDYFDLVRGMQTGDIARAKPFETKFLMAILNRDKIMDRFRKYYGGKKGKSNRRKKQYGN